MKSQALPSIETAFVWYGYVSGGPTRTTLAWSRLRPFEQTGLSG